MFPFISYRRQAMKIHSNQRYSDRGWDRVTAPGVNHQILYIQHACALIISHELIVKILDAFDDIHRFLTEKTYPMGMEKSEKRNFR